MTLNGITQENCFLRLQKAFDERGAYTVTDDMHRNVYISYFEDGGSRCISGKSRVENGKIVSVFLQYDDNTYELLDAKFYNYKKLLPAIINGISEMIYTSEGDKFKIVFIDKLKPKRKDYKEAHISLDNDEVYEEKKNIPASNSYSKEVIEVVYNKSAIKKEGEDDFTDQNSHTKFTFFANSGTEVYVDFSNGSRQTYSIIGDVNENVVENHRYLEFLVLSGIKGMIKMRYFYNTSDGVYLVFDDGTNIQFYHK